MDVNIELTLMCSKNTIISINKNIKEKIWNAFDMFIWLAKIKEEEKIAIVWI